MLFKTYPANIYLFEVNNRNTRKRCGICSKLTIKTPERRHWLWTSNCGITVNDVTSFLPAVPQSKNAIYGGREFIWKQPLRLWWKFFPFWPDFKTNDKYLKIRKKFLHRLEKWHTHRQPQIPWSRSYSMKL